MCLPDVRYPLPLLFILVSSAIFQSVVSHGLGNMTANSCSSDFYLLEENVLSNTQNRFELLRTFFPSKGVHPVFVEVNYRFVNGSNSEEQSSALWYWSVAEFYFVQPLEIFQYTSLFFSNFEYRKSTLEITLAAECADASHEKMELLTQRVRSQYPRTQALCGLYFMDSLCM